MLHTASGPFMTPHGAEKDISLAMATYLGSSFALIDSQMPEEENILRVAKGFHGLHLYANEFWVAHFLEYVELNPETDATVSDPVLERVLTLCDIHDSIALPSDDDENAGSTALHEIRQDAHPAFEKLKAHVDVHDFVRRIVEFRAQTRETQLQQSNGENPLRTLSFIS